MVALKAFSIFLSGINHIIETTAIRIAETIGAKNAIQQLNKILFYRSSFSIFFITSLVSLIL
jgi:hypothetical protein